MTIKSTKLAIMLATALSLAAPLALGTTPADAAPAHGGAMMMADRDHGDAFNDRRPAPRMEMRTHMAHRGYHWHQNHWNWEHGHRVWDGGFRNVR
jgi:hypothetical protein